MESAVFLRVPDFRKARNIGGSPSMNGISPAGPDLASLRAQLIDIMLGTVMLSIGLTECEEWLLAEPDSLRRHAS